LGEDTGEYLRQRPIKLTLHNVFWFNECTENFRLGLILQSDPVADIHVVGFEDDPQVHPMQGRVDLAGVLGNADDVSTEYLDLIWRWQTVISRLYSWLADTLNTASRYMNARCICPSLIQISWPSTSFEAAFALLIGITYLAQAGRWRYQPTRMRKKMVRSEILETVRSRKAKKSLYFVPKTLSKARLSENRLVSKTQDDQWPLSYSLTYAP
jgi:hypothetical protein